MKVLKEVQFTLTEEELREIILKHMMSKGELPEMEMTPLVEAKTSIHYREDEEVYKFYVTLEKGSVDE